MSIKSWLYNVGILDDRSGIEIICPVCKGRGYRMKDFAFNMVFKQGDYTPCPNCGGSGDDSYHMIW